MSQRLELGIPSAQENMTRARVRSSTCRTRTLYFAVDRRTAAADSHCHASKLLAPKEIIHEIRPTTREYLRKRSSVFMDISYSFTHKLF